MSADIANRAARLRERIAAAAGRSGRRADEITLIAVTKKQPASSIQEVLAAGITDIGENYVQEALAKREELGPVPARWHLLGHLQSNKVRQAGAAFDLIQSVDGVKLARALARQGKMLGKTQAILLQVHLGDEETKTGLPPEAALDAAAEVAGCDGLALDGLMGIAPADGDPRPHFAALRRLFEQLPPIHRRTLSMGMTNDFEAAIEEGATMVRIGTAIFGPRQ